MLKKTLPGTRADERTSFTVYTSHANLRRVMLSWENKAGGKLEGVHVSDLHSVDFGNERQAALAACLERTLGKPEIQETDHAKREVSYGFRRNREGDVWIYKGSLHLSRPAPNLWGAVTDALTSCP
ncbi:MAG: hypothetical protein FJ096_17605 [Deltaproteobacteria bacterium]|nr:hypothetical protein [Deltaproteobacteria bacterium]